MILQQVVNGLLLAGTYALIAMGFTLLVGVLDLLNLALGETLMVSGYAALVVMTDLHLPFVVALMAALAVGSLLSLVIYVISFRRVSKEYFTAPILSTLGVGTILTAAATSTFSSNARRFPTGLPRHLFTVGPVVITAAQLIELAISVAVVALVYLVVNRTKLGLGIRAVAERPSTAQLLGVPVEQTIVLTFIIAGAMAGVGGILAGSSAQTIDPSGGLNMDIVGLIIIVLGGLGNVVGAIVASVIIAVVETFSVAYISATAQDLVVYLLLFVVLVVCPRGLFGSRTRVEAI